MPYRKMPEVTPDWMKVSEAAARLEVTPKTILNRIKAGTLPVRVVRMERVVRVHRREFQEYLDGIATAASSGVRTR